MLQWLNGNENRRGAPNENYARELMELFTLGADRSPTPAYSEFDIREAARALTGWRNDYSGTLGAHNFRFDPNRHDTGLKKIFAGGTGVDSSPWNLHPRHQLERGGRPEALHRAPAPQVVLRPQALELLHPDAALSGHSVGARVASTRRTATRSGRSSRRS